MSRFLHVVVMCLLLCACAPSESDLTDQAGQGNVNAMHKLASMLLNRGDNAKATHWLRELAIKNDNWALEELKKLSAANEESAVGALSEYYNDRGQPRLAMEYYYKAAQINSANASTVAEFYLFGGKDKYGEEPRAIAEQRGLECLKIAAKSDPTRGYYVLLYQLSKDWPESAIGVAPAAERAEWAQIASSATNRDKKLVLGRLRSTGCPAAKAYANQLEESWATTSTSWPF